MQLQVYAGDINKLTTCIDSVNTRDDFRRFGSGVFDLFDSILVEAQAPQDPFLNLVDSERASFEQDFKEREISDCKVPIEPIKPDGVPEDYNPPIPTIPDAYLERINNGE